SSGETRTAPPRVEGCVDPALVGPLSLWDGRLPWAAPTLALMDTSIRIDTVLNSILLKCDSLITLSIIHPLQDWQTKRFPSRFYSTLRPVVVPTRDFQVL